MDKIDSELDGWEEILNLTGVGRPNTDPSKAQALTAQKIVISVFNLKEAIVYHRKITDHRLKGLTRSLDDFNAKSGKLARSANWLAGGLVILGMAQVIVAAISH